MKSKWPAIGLASILVAGVALLAGGAAAGPGPTSPAVHVTARVTTDGVRIVAQATAPFTYTTARPNDRLLVVTLPGVVAAEDSHTQMVAAGHVSSYRLVSYTEGSSTGLRLEVLLDGPVQPHFDHSNPEQLDLVFDYTPPANKPAAQPLAAHSAIVVTSAPAPISHVAVTEQGQAPRVRIEGQGDFHYHASRLTNPDRLVLDFADTTVATSNAIAGTAEPIKLVRVGQFQPGIARVVVELNCWTPYQVITSSNAIVVVFGDQTGIKETQPVPQQRTLLTTNRGIQAPKPKTVQQIQSIAPPQIALPNWLTETSFALASFVQPAPPPAQEQQNQPPAQLPVQQQLQQPVSQPMAASQPSQPSSVPQGPAATATPKYTGEPIRVNFKDVDLQDFFRLIHEVSGLNVVLDPSVKGSLTLVMDDVPWDQVLDIVLQNNALDKQLDGNVLRIATKATIKAEAEQRTALLQAQQDSVEPVTVTRQLSYARATQQQGGGAGQQQKGKALDELLRPFLSHRGNIYGDSRTNTLIIREIPANIPRLDDMIHQLDKKSRQVEIEARVVLASRNFARDIGTQLAAGGQSSNGRNIAGGTGGVGTSPIDHTTSPYLPPIVVGTSGSMPLITNFPAVAPTSGFSFTHISPNLTLDYVITAAESRGVAKLLSAPKVVTQSNVEGVVQQGQQIPIQTTINNTVSTQYVAAVLMLKVTPQITADGTIFMTVHVENTSIDTSISVLGQPGLDTQSVDNQVVAHDGETIQLGGVTINSQSNSSNQMPLIGSIPLIGNLFKERAVTVKAQTLLIFLTPRISPE
ncbi:MAG: type IV pilus secretin PilQ [Candidatus Acidiferrales bacterium]